MVYELLLLILRIQGKPELGIFRQAAFQRFDFFKLVTPVVELKRVSDGVAEDGVGKSENRIHALGLIRNEKAVQFPNCVSAVWWNLSNP